jgi:hypothetical protein
VEKEIKDVLDKIVESLKGIEECLRILVTKGIEVYGEIDTQKREPEKGVYRRMEERRLRDFREPMKEIKDDTSIGEILGYEEKDE